MIMSFIKMKKFNLYTDGSHFKSKTGSGRLGIGAVLVSESDNKIIDFMSSEVYKESIQELYRTSDVSNPTMEMYAVLQALRKFSNKFNFNDEIKIIADYIGVMNWMNHSWKINKPYILMIRTDIESEIKNQKLNVIFDTVKGHSGDYYNEMADKLAKGEYIKF